MNRRDFVAKFAVVAGAAAFEARGLTAAEPDTSVKRVLVMFKCHLDVGFVDTQAAIITKYFDQYFPRAIETANALRDQGKGSGGDRYVWTTGSWLVYEYLEQASASNRKRMEQAIIRGDIAWHALPFTWQTELLDRSMITGAIGFSKSLDRRFGRTTTGAKMTDVPGHSRGLIGPLAESGIHFLDIGVNAASTPPDVPDVFVWKDASGASLMMMYHRREYGGTVRIPGSDLAVAVEVRDDNSGPHTLDEISKIYADLRRRFPGAVIQAANLTEIANAVLPYKNLQPVLTQEIGDTWIYGVASDPVKLARFRELVRLRSEWVGQGKLAVGDKTDLAFLSKFALAAEHTWGTDTKTWLDFDHYTPNALARMLDDPKYKTVTGSWAEKRADIDAGVATLPPALRAEAEARVSRLKPILPDVSGMDEVAISVPLEGGRFTFQIGPTGALVQLHDRFTNRDWASIDHPLAAFSYQTLSKSDYDRFLASYITLQTDWAPKDFGKPNIERFGAISRTWTPKVAGAWLGQGEDEHRFVARLIMDDSRGQVPTATAWPAEMYLELRLTKSEPVIHATYTWFRKRSNRMPEALWLTFHPDAPDPHGWELSKVGQSVSPFDVVAGGNRHMHAVSGGVRYRDAHGGIAIESLDAPLVVLGEKSPIAFSKAQPDLAQGVHFSLFNNAWGTNYVQWFGDDMQFRFTIRT